MNTMRFVAPWYRREDYQRVRTMVRDKGNFPDTFEEWEQIAQSQLAQCHAQGMAVEIAILDPDGFAAYCADAKVQPDQQARMQYAAIVKSRETPGHG